MYQYSSATAAEYERDANVEYTRVSPTRSRRASRPSYSRGGSRPTAYNGIHRRRKKHWTW